MFDDIFENEDMPKQMYKYVVSICDKETKHEQVFVNDVSKVEAAKAVILSKCRPAIVRELKPLFDSITNYSHLLQITDKAGISVICNQVPKHYG